MVDGKSRIAIYLFTLFSTTGFCLYVGFFSFYLIKLNTNPLIVSALIGATALSSLFWGPIAGRMIDLSKYKFFWLFFGQIGCGVLVFFFGHLQYFSPVWTTALTLGFALILNLTLIITNQYLISKLHQEYETSVAYESRISGLAVFGSGVALATLYNHYPPFCFFTVSASCYLLSAMMLICFLREKTEPASEGDRTILPKRLGSTYYQSLTLIRKYWFLALSMCLLAFTETSFSTNFDVIAFSLGTTPFAVVFLFGAVSGALESAASWLYPKCFSHTTTSFRWHFFLRAFFIIFATAAWMSFWNMDSSPWFLPVVAIVLETVGIWWAIFIAGRVREASGKGAYGQTMAAFRMPRSLVTFIGITSIGAVLQTGALLWIFLWNAVLLGALFMIYLYKQSNTDSNS